MYMTDYLEAGILNTLKGTTLTAPSKVYIGLLLNDPTDTGAEGVEVNYTGYARVPLSLGDIQETGNVVKVSNDTSLVYATTDKAIGSISHVALYDALTGGNALAYSKMATTMAIQTDEAPNIAEGDITLGLSFSASKDFKRKILNYFKGQSITGMETYISLWSGDPDAGGAELTGTGYERKKVEFGALEALSSGATRMSNTQLISFDKPLSSWGIASYACLTNGLIGRDVSFIQELAVQKSVEKGVFIKFTPGNIRVSLN